MSNLNTERMVECSNVFQQSLEHVLSNLIGDSKTHINHFIISIILKEKPYLLVTEEGLQHAIKLVFSDDGYRDFIFMLSFTFFTRWGATEQDIFDLAGNLATGVSHAIINNSNNAVPNQIASRLTIFEDAKDLLAYNKWLMIVLLIQLFITVTPEVKEKTNGG